MSKIIIMDGDEYTEYIVSSKKRYIKHITLKDIIYTMVIMILLVIMYFNYQKIEDSILAGSFVHKKKVYKIIPY